MTHNSDSAGLGRRPKTISSSGSIFIPLLVLVFSQTAVSAGQGTSKDVLQPADYDAFTRIPRRPAALALQKVAPAANFEVTYTDFPAPAQAAFQYAIDIWSQLIVSPITIRVNAEWVDDLGGALGRAGSNRRWQDFMGAAVENTLYSDTFTDAATQIDINPGEFDINARFASTIDWYFGTDGNTPEGQFDFVSVVLHEIGHGIGYAGGAAIDDGADQDECAGVVGEGCIGQFPVSSTPLAFDRFVENGSGTQLISGFANPSAAMADQLTGGDLFFNAPRANAANGGTPPELYAPDPFEEGSSFSHFDEAIYPAGNPHSLMTPKLARAEAIHDPGDVALCMFEAMGLATVADCEGGDPPTAPILLNRMVAECFSFQIGAGFTTYYDDLDRGVEAADQFTVPGGETWFVARVQVQGTFSEGAPPPSSVNVRFFQGASAPGAVACARPAELPVGGTSDPDFKIELSSPCELGPGTYWVDVQPVFDSIDGTPVWFWWETNSGAGQYQWRDSTDLFGTGCTEFSEPTGCNPSTGGGVNLCWGLMSDNNNIFANSFEGGNGN